MSVVLRKVSRRTIRQLLSEANSTLMLPKEEQEITSVVDGMLKAYCDSGKNNYIELQFIEENRAWELVEYVFRSNKRSIKDVFFIVRYLALFEKFISVVNDASVELFELLLIIAKGVERDAIIKNRIICKVGECVEKCCLLIRGSIAVLKVKECKMNLTKSEYVSHLEMLYSLNEYELLSRTIKANAYLNTYWNIPQHLQSNDAHTDIRSLSTQPVVSSVNDYILQLTPHINKCSSNNTEQPFEIELFLYDHYHSLSHGDTFNESSLSTEASLNKQSYTLIAISQCECISLPKRIYVKALKHAKIKQRNINISYLLTNTLFLHVSASVFDKCYFNYFKPHTFYLGDYIYYQNDHIKDIIIIQDGEVELSLKTSFNFLEELIKSYGGRINYKSFFDNVHDIQRCISCIGNKVTYHKLYVINNKEIFGLDDVVYSEGKVLFNAKVVSSKCKVFMIDVKLFEKVVMKDKCVMWNRLNVVKKRKRLLMEKMLLIRKVLINQYKFLKGIMNSERGVKDEMKPSQGKIHLLKKSQSLSPLRFPVVKDLHNNNINCNGIRFRNKRDEYLPRFTNSSLRSVLCCTHNKSKDELTFEHNNNNDKETDLINTYDNNTNNNIMCNNNFKTSYTNIFHNININNTHYSPLTKQDALTYKMRCFKYRKSNTLNTLTPPFHPSINNTTINSKDESTSPHNFPKSNSCLFKRDRHVFSMESLKNENLLLTSHISDRSVNVDNIISEMNVLSKESQRLRVRKNPLNIRNINNKEVMIQHLLMHKIGKDITRINHKQPNSNNIMTRTIDFLAMDRFVELVQGNATTRRYKPKGLNCKIKNGLNRFIKSSYAY